MGPALELAPPADASTAPATGRPVPRPSLWLAAWTLAVRELVRFFRQRTRVIGALAQPILFWIVLGTGMKGSFRPPGWAGEGADLSFQAYFFPGVAVMICLFTAIFATISVIEDRREGFLQGVLAAPVPRLGLVLGKVFGGAAIAVVQAALFLLLGPLLAAVGLAPDLGLNVTPLGGLLAAAWLVLLGVGLTALGYCLAWPMESTQGFHAVMSVFLLPMWLLSGAAFPAEDGPLRWVVAANPLSYGVAGLRRSLDAGLADVPGRLILPSMPVCFAVFGLCTAVLLAVAVWMTRRPSVRDAR